VVSGGSRDAPVPSNRESRTGLIAKPLFFQWKILEKQPRNVKMNSDLCPGKWVGFHARIMHRLGEPVDYGRFLGKSKTKEIMNTVRDITVSHQKGLS
jgi:hypothetical protein